MNNFTKVVTNKFKQTVQRFSMLENVETVVVGFSGGADSVCLLHLLDTFKNEYGYSLKAIHVNHGIRGEEAKRDEFFAKDFCEKFGIPFEVVAVNCLEEAKKSKETLEECGRRLRYLVFNSFCDVDSCIATAHNANDNAETVIFNMVRGTTVKGLCGIPFVRDNIIRPVLDCSRTEIEGYCKENNLDFVTDSTNLSDDYTRNKIRHNVLNIFEEINPSFLDAFSSLCANASDVSDFLITKSEDVIVKAQKGKNTYDRALLLEAPSAVSSEVLFKVISQFCGKSADNKKVKEIQALLQKGGRVQIYGNSFAEVKKDYLRFFVDNIEQSENSKIIINEIPFSVDFNKYTILLEKFVNNSKIVHQNTYCDMVDYDTVVGKLVLRTRQPGDKFTFKNRNVTKSLKKLFTEEDIPIEERNTIPVIADDIGVVWVQGFGATKRCCVKADSDNIVFVRGKNNDR